MAVEMGDGAEAHRAGPVGIDLGDAALAEMGDGAEPQPPRLLDRRRVTAGGTSLNNLTPS